MADYRNNCHLVKTEYLDRPNLKNGPVISESVKRCIERADKHFKNLFDITNFLI